MKKKRLIFTSLLFIGIIIFSCQKKFEKVLNIYGKIELHFQNKAGTDPLIFGTTYTNNTGENFSVTKFKYYVTNIELINTLAQKKEAIPDSYFLVDEEKAASKILSLSVPEGSYNAVSFLLGVDSIRNSSGAQTGALDPLNAMFWTWNSGYIMAKLEGTSPASTNPNNMIEYHIGGFKGDNNVLQTITLPFPGNAIINVKGNKKNTIEIKTDIMKWFNGNPDLSIATTPTCTTPGALAKQISENYKNMFSIGAISQ